jgi:hypothetical protein
VLQDLPVTPRVDDFNKIWRGVEIVTLLVMLVSPVSCYLTLLNNNNNNSVALVRERTIPTERPPLLGEASANFCE